MITKTDLEKAWTRTRPYVVNTPFLRSRFLSNLWNAEVFLKHEQQQEIGAFKIRGASNFCNRLTGKSSRSVYITHSSGNHAQALAYMAHKLGAMAIIVMPKNSNKRKVENARKWGAEIQFCEPTFEARLDVSNKIEKETGGIMIPPFDHEWIIEGQATAAMEIILDQTLDIIITPLGGGGLLSGTALAAKYFSPNTQVIGTEPATASDGYDGFHSGQRVKDQSPNTVADGLRTLVGEIPYEIIKREVNDIWLAEEESIIPWMYRIWKEENVVMEPSCAVPFAAIHEQKELVHGKKVGIVITGGNIDLNDLPTYSEAGL